MATTASFPILPIEITYLILEHTANICPEAALRLVLVAKDVQSVIDRLLYKSIILNTDKSLHLFLQTLCAGTKPASFYAEAVRCVCIWTSITDTELMTIITSCRGVKTIAIASSEGLAGVPPSPGCLAQLSNDVDLRRLTCPWGFIDSQLDFTSATFSNLTHLELIIDFKDLPWDKLHELQCVTHLSFIDMTYESTSTDLMSCAEAAQLPTLAVACIMFLEETAIAKIPNEWYRNHDPRIVLGCAPSSLSGEHESVLIHDYCSAVVFVEDWALPPFGTSRLWERAEEISASQRALQRRAEVGQ